MTKVLADSEHAVVRQQLTKEYYTVFSSDMLSEAEFQTLLTPEERLKQQPIPGFVEPTPYRLPEQAGSFVHIKGKLHE